MVLTLNRKWFTDKSTVGELSIDTKFECYTLEDCVRNEKIQNITAIPYGMYEIAVTFSNRFQKPMPQLLNVPGFQGIRIHSGNKAEDTEGCILVGRVKSPDFIGESRLAFQALFSKLQAALKKEKVFIEIKSAPAK